MATRSNYSGPKSVVASGLATVVAEVVTLPICTLKTNYQNDNHNTRILEVFRKIYLTHGIAGFYRSSFAAIGSQVLSTTTKYFWYSYLNAQLLSNSNENNNNNISTILGRNIFLKFGLGAISGVLGTVMTHPIDVCKIYYQMNNKLQFLTDLRTIGPRLFYRGYTKTLSKGFFGSILYYPIFDILYIWCKTYDLDDLRYRYATPIAGFGSSMIATLCMQPIDYMKVRNIYGEQYLHGWNPLNYCRGLSLNMIRIVPHFMITMTGIKYLESIL
jgi:hypothetical protein